MASPRPSTSVSTYLTGFVLSLVCTIVPFLLVINRWLSGAALVTILLVFAVAQLYVQLVFFLHIGQGRDRRWNTIAFLFMLMVVLIVVIGSLWIMQNLNYNMMSPERIDEQILEDEGFNQ